MDKLTKNYEERFLRLNLEILAPDFLLSDLEPFQNVTRSVVESPSEKTRKFDRGLKSDLIVFSHESREKSFFDLTYFFVDPLTFRILVKFKP